MHGYTTHVVTGMHYMGSWLWLDDAADNPLCATYHVAFPAAAAGGTRLQDELHITITKALSHSHPGYKRIGVVGSLALLGQAAAEHELLADADGTAAGAAP